jgi:hypothetical protein
MWCLYSPSSEGEEEDQGRILTQLELQQEQIMELKRRMQELQRS